MNSQTTHQSMKVAAYGWLRWPSVLLGGIGVWGILNAKVDVVAQYSELFILPPLVHCYAITGGAVILFGIATFYRQTKLAKPSDTASPHEWRGR